MIAHTECQIIYSGIINGENAKKIEFLEKFCLEFCIMLASLLFTMLKWMCHEKREKLNADKENGAHGSLH